MRELHDLEGGKTLKKTIDGFGGKWIRRGMKGKPIRMNLTCHDASNIAHNWQLIPSNLDRQCTEKRTKPSVFSASSQSSIYYYIATKWVGTEQPKLVACWFRKSGGQSCTGSSTLWSLWGVRGQWQSFLTVGLLSGWVLNMVVLLILILIIKTWYYPSLVRCTTVPFSTFSVLTDTVTLDQQHPVP